MKSRQTVVAIVVVLAGVGAILYDHAGRWAPAQLVGAAILAPCAILWMIARLNLGASFAVSAQAQALVTSGLYSRIRDPIYVFGTGVIVGALLLIGKPYFLLGLLVIVPVQVVRARREARVLEAAFGDQYRAYRKRTWL